MKFKIEIDCDNAAFQPEPTYELGQIMGLFSQDLSEGFFVATRRQPCNLRDHNGSTVGRAWFEDDGS